MGMLADERSTNHFEEVLTLNKGQFDASVLVKKFLEKKNEFFIKKYLKLLIYNHYSTLKKIEGSF